MVSAILHNRTLWCVELVALDDEEDLDNNDLILDQNTGQDLPLGLEQETSGDDDEESARHWIIMEWNHNITIIFSLTNCRICNCKKWIWAIEKLSYLLFLCQEVLNIMAIATTIHSFKYKKQLRLIIDQMNDLWATFFAAQTSKKYEWLRICIR